VWLTQNVPALNQLKNYQPNSYYHVFNHAANGGNLFIDNNDYWVFRRIARQEIEKRNLMSEVSDPQILIDTFCCLPTHYHFLIYQADENQIRSFMKSLGVRYAMYLNRKYNRRGRLFEDSFKAIHLPTPQDVERVRKYILDNPINKGYLSWKHVGRNI